MKLRQHRGILAVLTLLALAGASVGAGWYYFFHQLPHPRDATRHQLFRWVVQRDVASEPYEIQVALVDRLEAELPKAMELNKAASRLAPHHREQLHRNLQQLKKVWFTIGADRFAECPADQRVNFLERRLQTIHQVSSILAREGGSSSDWMEGFLDDIEHWMTQADAERRQRMVDVVEAALLCWLATDNLETKSFDMRRKLASRIAKALDRRLTAEIQISIVDSVERRNKLRSNSLLLFEAWFRDRAVVYESMPTGARDDYVAEQIKRVYRWHVLDFLMQSDSASSQHPPSDMVRMMRLAKQVETWIERADEPDRRRIRDLFTHVQRLLISGAVKLPSPP